MPAKLDLSSGIKRCTICGEPKPLDDFYKARAPRQGRNGYWSMCKPCALKKSHAAAKTPAGRVGARRRMYRYHLRKTYGLTVEDYELMSEAQGGVCAICKGPETAVGPAGEVKPLSIDHNHATGVVRGLVCHYCNVVIGMSLEDPARLEAAAAYLRR